MNDIFEFSKIIDLLIPEGTDQEINVDGTKIHISKKDGKVNIKTVEEKDSIVKQHISEFSDKLEEIDDDMFVEICEEFGDANEFNQLLELDNFTEEQAEQVESGITRFSQIACQHIQKKIQELVNLYDRF